jgi:asparagine synthase (glutamine-hydrolysing)
MMFVDTVTYLPDDILVKLDRATMAVSLEARVPLLDHRIVEFAWSLPLAMKISGGCGKRILRDVLRRYIPADHVVGQKRGFVIPLADWLRGPLRDWAEALLDRKRLRQDGMLNPEPIHSRWRQHVDGVRDWHESLWSVLMLQAWLDAYRAHH